MKSQATQQPQPARGPRPKHLRKELLARFAGTAIDRADQKLSAIADDFDTDAPNVCRWKQPHEPHAPSALHLLAAAGTASHGVAVDLHRGIGDELGVQTIPRVEVLHGDDHVARLSALTVETTDVPRALSVALADGDLSDEEIEALRREGRESVAAVLELDAYLVREQQRRRGQR